MTNPTPLVEHVKYCPRCDRRFFSTVSETAALKSVTRHVHRAHPEYEIWEDEISED